MNRPPLRIPRRVRCSLQNTSTKSVVSLPPRPSSYSRPHRPSLRPIHRPRLISITTAAMNASSSASAPILKDLVLLGGGHSHLSVLRMFGMKPMPGVQITLITRDIHTPYSGMLPGYVSGAYSYDDCHIDLSVLATFAGARLIHAEASGLDLEGKRVLFNDRPPIPFDVLSVNLGITPAAREVPGAMQHTTPVKPIDGFVRRFDQLIARSFAAESSYSAAAAKPLRVAVVGGGAGGVEIALALKQRLLKEYEAKFNQSKGGSSGSKPFPPPPEVSLITRGEVLEQNNAWARSRVKRLLKEKGVDVREKTGVDRVEPRTLVLSNGSTFEFDECLWCTQAAPAPWVKSTALATDDRGFIAINETLQSSSHPFVFACGDVATCAKHPRPKAGVFAVRQGPPLAQNLARFLEGQAPSPFVPQTNFLSIIAIGANYGVATRGSWSVEGAWVWTLKDWIDRSFMNKFSRDLPEMGEEDGADSPALSVASGPEALAVLTAAKMRCGGCGAKVGASTLSRVLSRLASEFQSLRDPSQDVLIGLDSPDDAAVLRPPPPGHVMIQTVDFFRSFIDDPFVFGKIAANHALSDIYAMGAKPSSALAIAVVPFGAEAKVEDTLFQMMAGALTVLEEAGCVLAGGHTCEGQELALGFSVTGACPETEVIRKGGAKAGDAIVLTKPLGTGVLFAANMRRQSKGRWISRAVASMCQSNGPSAEIMKGAGCTALTDVTGFGLVGHLQEILKASRVRAELDLASIPTIEGALELSAQGIVSSLHAANTRAAAVVQNAAELAKEGSSSAAQWALLLDPQTSGGLVGSVPADRAQECVQKLRDAGYEAAVIGSILEGSDSSKTEGGDIDAAACGLVVADWTIRIKAT